MFYSNAPCSCGYDADYNPSKLYIPDAYSVLVRAAYSKNMRVCVFAHLEYASNLFVSREVSEQGSNSALELAPQQLRGPTTQLTERSVRT